MNVNTNVMTMKRKAKAFAETLTVPGFFLFMLKSCLSIRLANTLLFLLCVFVLPSPSLAAFALLEPEIASGQFQFRRVSTRCFLSFSLVCLHLKGRAFDGVFCFVFAQLCRPLCALWCQISKNATLLAVSARQREGCSPANHANLTSTEGLCSNSMRRALVQNFCSTPLKKMTTAPLVPPLKPEHVNLIEKYGSACYM